MKQLGGVPPTPQQNQHVWVRLQNGTQSGYAQNRDVEFVVNPEELSVQMPSRVTTLLTVAGAYQDAWGDGLFRVTISGNTGWRKKTDDGPDGYELYIQMREVHRDYQRLCAENDPALVNMQIIMPPGIYTVPKARGSGLRDGNLPVITGLSQEQANAYNTSQFAYFRVSSDTFQAQRSRAQPLLFRYTWEFTVIKDLLDSHSPDRSARFVLQGAGQQDGMSGSGASSTVPTG